MSTGSSPTGGAPTGGSSAPAGTGDWFAAGASSAVFFNAASYQTGVLFATGGSGASFAGAGQVVRSVYGYVYENFTATDRVTPPAARATYVAPVSDAFSVGLATTAKYGVHLTQDFSFGSTGTYVWTPGAVIMTGFTFGDQLNAVTYSRVAMTERLNIIQTQVLALLAGISEHFMLTPVLEAYAGSVLLNRLLLTDTAHASMRYGVSMSQALQIAETFHKFIGAEAFDTLGISDAADVRYNATASIMEFLALSLSQSYVMAFRLTINETVEVDDEIVLQMIYSESMTEVIDLEILYQSPDGNVTTFAINTRTGAATEYQGWNFNSFVPLGNRYIAANKDGLYELNGPTDNGLSVVAEIVGGFIQPGGAHLSGLKGVYLGQSGTGYWLLKIETGDGREYVYQRLSNPAMMTTKFVIGKGINARYIGWTLMNVEGQDFDLDEIEFVPMIRTRRI